MNFHVEHQRLRDCANVMNADSESAFVAADYAKTSVDLHSQAGVIFAHIAETHQQVATALGESFSHLTGLLSGSGKELAASADVYQHTDKDHAEQLGQIHSE